MVSRRSSTTILLGSLATFAVPSILIAGSVSLELDDIEAGEPIDAAQMRTRFEELEAAINDNDDRSVPIGSVIAFAGPVPTGWLECDGRAIDGDEYPALFAAIGTAWGDGSSCRFGTTGDACLPDLRGQFLRGADNDAPPCRRRSGCQRSRITPSRRGGGGRG